jgi:SAM-dependent methyltransferase
VDVNPDYVNLAKANARRYGLEDRIHFLHVDDTSRLPYPDEQFHYITCNSVLEYVPHRYLAAVQREINRLLKVQGLLFVLGTSNRLWPREIHSQILFTNYLPRSLDSFLFPAGAPERGVFPWEVVGGFNKTACYENNDVKDAGKVYLRAREKMGNSAGRLRVLETANRILGLVGLSPGLLTPSLSVILRKVARRT